MPGTPATSPRFGAPRIGSSDDFDIVTDLNAVTDTFDLKAQLADLNGTYAARPAASSALNGVRYYATDKGTEYQCISAAWVLIGARAVVSATKPTSPVDGQRWAYIAEDGVRWEFVWRDASAGSNKWEAVSSGTPVVKEIASLTQLAGGPTAVTGATYTVPFTGDWLVAIGAPSMQNTNAGASNIGQLHLFKGAGQQAKWNTLVQLIAGASTWGNAHAPERPLACTAADVLQIYTSASVNQINFANLILSVRPKALA